MTNISAADLANLRVSAATAAAALGVSTVTFGKLVNLGVVKREARSDG